MFNIAVVGATGLVGNTIVEILEQRNFPIKKLFLLASSRSAGETLLFKNRPIEVHDLANFDFKLEKIDIAFFSAGGSVSSKYVKIAAAAGCIVIDNTSHFRYQKDIPLIIPEVNPDDLEIYKNTNIIANPNCATIQSLLVLKPIYDLVGISKIDFVKQGDITWYHYADLSYSSWINSTHVDYTGNIGGTTDVSTTLKRYKIIFNYYTDN